MWWGGSLIADRIQIEGYRWVQNIVQRNKKGGKPALLISEKDYHIKNLCPDIITVPVGVEAVWALLTPKQASASKVKQIAVASVYYSSKQTKRSDFLDHISLAYNTLCAKYGSDLKFIISGDFNRMNIKPILNLSSDLRQVVQVVTRTNPDSTLDLIITNLQSLYHPPTTLPPLDNDENNDGKPSDHLIVVMKPLSNLNPSQAVRYKKIKYRPFPDSGIRQMGLWVQSQSWKEIYSEMDPDKKAELFESIMMEKVNLFFPEKVLKINENDKPWANSQLLVMDRQRKREYNKFKKSDKWKRLNQLFLEKAAQLKEEYYENMVEDLKYSNVGQWYSKVKRMSQLDPTKEEKILVENISDQTSEKQAEIIADEFAKISNL